MDYIIIGVFQGRPWIVRDENTDHILFFKTEEEAAARIVRGFEVDGWFRGNAYYIEPLV